MDNREEIISEIAHRCDDVGWRDFDRGEYINALYRTNRLVARKYHLFQKIEQFTLSNRTSDLTKDILLDLPDMKEVILVSVNDINLRKKDVQILEGKDMYCYYMFRQPDGTYFFNYVNGMTLEDETILVNADISASLNTGLTDRVDDSSGFGKSATDKITILYESIPERDYDSTEYIIPPNYEEEQIEYAVFHMAMLGIAKFKEQKLEKYSRIYKLYRKDSDYNREVVESKEPVRIQIFHFP